MTSTGTFQGLQDKRNSSKVLKPPGGGSSDIFGATNDVDSPRRAKQQHNHSQLGAGFFGNGEQQQLVQPAKQPVSNGSSAPETPRSNKPGNDSQARLFGPPDLPSTQTPHKDRMRSQIMISCAPEAKPHLANGNDYQQNDVPDGNPVTGTGYDLSHQNGNASGGSSSAGSDKSSTDSSPSVNANVPRMKNRVPPGGFSSGLW